MGLFSSSSEIIPLFFMYVKNKFKSKKADKIGAYKVLKRIPVVFLKGEERNAESKILQIPVVANVSRIERRSLFTCAR